ncbi:MAG: dihydroorotate dehydrogenase electron transfer subunit [Armatimonadota bacterium]
MRPAFFYLVSINYLLENDTFTPAGGNAQDWMGAYVITEDLCIIEMHPNGVSSLIATVIENKEMAPGCRYLLVYAPEIARAAKPGLFVHVLCGTSYDPLLRRPLGIHEADPETGRFAMLYEVRGKGTSLLAERCVGDRIDILGPLGNGFTLPESDGLDLLLVAGGIGVAPLYYLAKELHRRGGYRKLSVILGARNCDMILRVDDFRLLTDDLRIATDDGSMGCCGFVTTPLDQYMADAGTGVRPLVFACGPMSMLRAIASTTRHYNLNCQVSTEAKMACGVGACMSCVIKLRTDLVIADGSFRYVRSCKEGPVFNADEVIW